jgi:predicted PurR-regulated permease PerM
VDQEQVGKPRRDAGAVSQSVVIDIAIRLWFLGLLAYWSLTIVRPFLTIMVWAVILTVALYPLYRWLTRVLFGSRVLAAALITLAGLAIIFGPAAALLLQLSETIAGFAHRLQAGDLHVPPPPESVKAWPLIGADLYQAWSLTASDIGRAWSLLQPKLASASPMLLKFVADIGGEVLAMAASTVISGFLFLPAARMVDGARAFASRLVTRRGEGFVDLAGATIRNVSRGIIGVSLLQALLAGTGLLVMGVPMAGTVTVLVLILGIIQIGGALPLLGVIIWAWLEMSNLDAAILTAYLVPVALIDNVLKPIVMAQGLTTPMLVILVGVIGGTLTHGLIGLFLGPIVLAVFYDLLVAWVRKPLGAEDSKA